MPGVRGLRICAVRLNGPGPAPVLGTETAAERGTGSGDRVTEAVQDRETLELPLGQTARWPARQSPHRGLPVLEERLRGTKFVSLTPKSILNSPQQTGTDFWSLNPYVGCEFGCSYCYARYAHRYVVERAHDAGKVSDAELPDFRGPHGWEAFERRIFVKDQLLAALEADLRRYRRSGGPAGGPTAPLVIGTATDPYQPAERHFRLTRRILERLARCEGLNVGVITKSPLVARDRDVLRAIQQRSDLEVYLSLITVDRALIKKVEARSPMPAARLAALAKLAAAGINVGLIAAPILPGITDDVPHLEALFRAARDAGARFVHTGPLRLYTAVRERFLPVLGQHFPELTLRYERAYARHSAVPREYARALAARVRALQVRFGFPVNDGMVDRYRPRRALRQGELGL
jgi:DNA repair photolyase